VAASLWYAREGEAPAGPGKRVAIFAIRRPKIRIHPRNPWIPLVPGSNLIPAPTARKSIARVEAQRRPGLLTKKDASPEWAQPSWPQDGGHRAVGAWHGAPVLAQPPDNNIPLRRTPVSGTICLQFLNCQIRGIQTISDLSGIYLAYCYNDYGFSNLVI